MCNIISEKPIAIREDYVDAAERCAVLAEKISKGQSVDKEVLKQNVKRWRELRKELK